MKMKMKKIPSTNQQLSTSGNGTEISVFQIFKHVNPIPLKTNHQIFSILITCHIFFLPENASFGDSPMVKLFYRNLSGYAGISTIENMVDNRSLSTDEITSSDAELLFT